MNWGYFLILLFVFYIGNCLCGTLLGAFEVERETHYTKLYGAINFMIVIILVLMWFWT